MLTGLLLTSSKDFAMTTRSAPFGVMSGFVGRPPYRLQIAYDGDWMNAWRFGQDALPSPELVLAALAGRGADVAVEFCFKLSTGEDFFFGQRRLGQPEDPMAVAFVNRALACGIDQNWTDLPGFLSRLERVTSEVEQIGEVVLCHDLANIEIGITDWWRRGDVVEVWNRVSGSAPERDELAARMESYPSLMRNDINFVCLEFNFLTPVHHWFGVEISEPGDGFHDLQISKASSWLARCLP